MVLAEKSPGIPPDPLDCFLGDLSSPFKLGLALPRPSSRRLTGSSRSHQETRLWIRDHPLATRTQL